MPELNKSALEIDSSLPKLFYIFKNENGLKAHTTIALCLGCQSFLGTIVVKLYNKTFGIISRIIIYQKCLLYRKNNTLHVRNMQFLDG